MNKPQGFDNVEPITSSFEKLKAGGYICKILNAETFISRKGNEMLRLGCDIAEGQFKDYFQKQYEKFTKNDNAFWGRNYYQGIGGDVESMGRLKGFLMTIKNNNPNFKWDWDEKTLVGKRFGGVFGEEEYINKDGLKKVALKLKYIQDIKGIENAKIPEKKLLKGTQMADSMGTELPPDEEIPF